MSKPVPSPYMLDLAAVQAVKSINSQIVVATKLVRHTNIKNNRAMARGLKKAAGSLAGLQLAVVRHAAELKLKSEGGKKGNAIRRGRLM